MKRKIAVFALLYLMMSGHAGAKPNVVIMVTDNVGWGEIGAYGGGILRGAATPRLDTLSEEGMKLLNFNVDMLCTPSRSALMTGRYPIRSGTTKVTWGVPYGLVGWEKTIAELMSEAGYKTGIFGKWHLGDIEGRFPTDQGFDEWYGIPNTTDEAMYTSQPGFDAEIAEIPVIMESKRGEVPSVVKKYNLDSRRKIDSELNERAIEFMKESVRAKKPFFVYLPYTQAHIPSLPHPDFEGKTGNGVWADMLAELDFRAGEILDSIDNLNIRDNTVVIWMSEGGPERVHSDFGSTGYWRGHYYGLEGSIRAPFLIRWPAKISAGAVSNEIVHITDLLPTLANVAGYNVPRDRIIDGTDQMNLFTGVVNKSSREGVPVYYGNQLLAYKWRNYKVLFMKQEGVHDAPELLDFPLVFNLLRDPKELFGISGGRGESGLVNLTWVLPVVSEKIFEFNETFAEEPPIPPGTPEPYRPATTKVD